MTIISRYVREQKRYSKRDLKRKFDLNEDSFAEFINELRSLKFLNVYVNSQKDSTDYNESDIELKTKNYDNGNYSYVFIYVGIITIKINNKNIVIKSFPKYILNKEEPFEEMKEVLKVLDKYNNSKENIIELYSGYEEEKEFNFLSICLYLLNNYYENGIYTNQQEIVETNGEGEILWDNTINETFAIIIDNRPYYTELQTENVIDDESDYITRLHKFVITDCCRKLKEADLLELFDIEDIDLSDEEREFFGDDEYIIFKIQRELSVQFITWKQTLLKTLAIYISNEKSFEEGIGLTMYGTNSFYAIWEEACAKAFDNKLDTKLEDLNLPVDLHEDYVKMRKIDLIKIIKYPIWTSFDDGIKEHNAKGTLIPDLISLFKIQEGMCFGIFDAKYYNIVLSKNKVLQNYPGVGDVTKQHLYQLAFKDFIDKHKFAFITNAFLMPTEDDDSILIGDARMEILEELPCAKLISISVIKLSARKIFKCYLSGKKLDIGNEFQFLNGIVKENK